MVTELVKSKKNPAISVTLLLIIATSAVIAYFAAPTVMTYIMLQQERAKATSPPVAPPSFNERPEGLTLGAGNPSPPRDTERDTPPK